MIKKQSTPAKEAVQRVLREANIHVGMTESLGMQSKYGKQVGYNGHPWAGAFLDVVFHSCGVRVPSCVYTASALAEFIRTGRFHHTSPQLGDIVFFPFPSGHNTPFIQMHAGIVTDLAAYETTGQIGTIEGQTSPDGQQVDGVYRRVRSRHEVLGYGRPDYSKPMEVLRPATAPEIYVDRVRPPRRNTDIGHVQRALAVTAGWRLRYSLEDLYDQETQAAYNRWQRILGYVGPDANGIPDLRSLTALGETTGYFRVTA